METGDSPSPSAAASTSSWPVAHRLDDLPLEGLVPEELQALEDGVLVADEGLVLGHDLAHGGLDALEVVVAEVDTAGELEVVVEAVLDDRADGVVGAGPQPEHGLGQHVGGRVAQHGPSGVGIGGDDRDQGAVGELGAQVDLDPVEGGGHGRLGQAGPDGLSQLQGGRTLFELLGRAIGKSNSDGCHGYAFLDPG